MFANVKSSDGGCRTTMSPIGVPNKAAVCMVLAATAPTNMKVSVLTKLLGESLAFPQIPETRKH
jgi:hypothetical protein